LILDLEGIQGDRHYGYTAVSGGRLKRVYEPGTVFRNNRQWLAISPVEIKDIRNNLGLDSKLSPELLGANLLLEGVDNLSELAPLSYIVFSPNEDYLAKDPDNVTLVVYAQALPCKIAGRALVKPFDNESLESKFPKASIGLRGLCGWVEKGGIIKPGYTGWILKSKGLD